MAAALPEAAKKDVVSGTEVAVDVHDLHRFREPVSLREGRHPVGPCEKVYFLVRNQGGSDTHEADREVGGKHAQPGCGNR